MGGVGCALPVQGPVLEGTSTAWGGGCVLVGAGVRAGRARDAQGSLRAYGPQCRGGVRAGAYAGALKQAHMLETEQGCHENGAIARVSR